MDNQNVTETAIRGFLVKCFMQTPEELPIGLQEMPRTSPTSVGTLSRTGCWDTSLADLELLHFEKSWKHEMWLRNCTPGVRTVASGERLNAKARSSQ